eukprot:TRINITY_DN9143_c0_g1_i1.p1 TRINITY_DN9143_c0_g1~~TRINITY_DN9143_c0_g1_i1.p1  ORF type:complete len:269 (+),score=50.73 TRINITY_DN9143_c0_g1_i1:50-808(+)
MCTQEYAYALYMQGKTTEALKLIDRFINQLNEITEQHPQNLSAYIHNLDMFIAASQICSQQSRWKELIKYLTPVIEYVEMNYPTIPESLQPLKLFCDAATAYREIGQEDDALEMEKKIRWFCGQYLLDVPLTSSPYLTTVKYKITKEDGFYLLFKINKYYDPRQEGESISDVVPKFKIYSCYLHITIQNDSSSYKMIAHVPQPPQIEINTEGHSLPFTITNDSWFKLILDIYSDEQLTVKIGTHHQLLYSSL